MTAAGENDRFAPAVVVTGAGSGIGNAVTRSLLARGYRVLGAAIAPDEAEALARDLGERFTPFVVDVRDEADAQAAADRVAHELAGRPLKALLNIAGVIANGPLVDLTAAEFRDILAVNLVGVHAVTRAFLPLLSAGGGGRIVNISSASGRRTLPFTGAYGPSKFAVEALSSVMRMEFAPLGVEVVVIAPGPIDTPMADRIKRDLACEPSLPVYREPLRRFLERTERSFAHGIPLGRVAATFVEAVDAPRPKLRYELHQNVLRDVLLMRLLPTRRREAIVRRTLALDPRQTA